MLPGVDLGGSNGDSASPRDFAGAVDLSTVFGVFCREDYPPPAGSRVVIDIGANIGIATLFFVSRNREALVYAYEPVDDNVEMFRRNVGPFRDRCTAAYAAIFVGDCESVRAKSVKRFTSPG